jgi:protein-S-isoprenylcysteine O-methyltransferase Ste14
MTPRLFFEAIFKFLLGVLLVGALLFLPLGSFSYFGGWLLLAVLFVPMFFAGIVMMIKNPALLASRLDAREGRKSQDTVIKLSALMFILGFVTASLSARFSLLTLSPAVSIVGAVIFLIAYILYAEVLRENEYLSRTIRVVEGQRVVDTGMYSLVRHPMYSVTLLLFISIPIVLGSLLALIPFLFYPFIIAKRILDEERLLEAELIGYTEYKQRVKYRLIPFIW